MACDLVWEPEGVIKRFSGTVSGAEFLHAVERVQSDARYDHTHYVINDFTTASAHELTRDVLVEAAVLQYGAHASNPNCRIVFVTTDVRLIALIKMAGAFQLESYETSISPSLAEARDWLSRQPQLQLMSNVMGFRIG